MAQEHAIWILLAGLVVILSSSLQAAGHRLRLPWLVGCMLFGVLLKWMDREWGVLGQQGRHSFTFLADLGIVAILFRVGLHSDLNALVAKLRPAALIWCGNVVLAGFLGYLAARFGGGLDVLPAAVVGVAMTATSIGVSSAAWDQKNALQSGNGQLMLDVAEMDDVSGVVFMAILFALVPVIVAGGDDLGQALFRTGSIYAAKFLGFATVCFLAARYLERPLARFAESLPDPSQRMLPVAGTGLAIAAIAAWLDFSLAIGALFAGLVFSRDPVAVREEARFDDLYAFFAPFFFVGIGLQVGIDVLAESASLGLWLLAAAVAGKFLGALLPALMVTDTAGATLISVSLIPRAEIAMVIAWQGTSIGVLSESAYTALALVSAATCLMAPWLIHVLLERWPQRRAAAG